MKAEMTEVKKVQRMKEGRGRRGQIRIRDEEGEEKERWRKS